MNRCRVTGERIETHVGETEMWEVAEEKISAQIQFQELETIPRYLKQEGIEHRALGSCKLIGRPRVGSSRAPALAQPEDFHFPHSQEGRYHKSPLGQVTERRYHFSYQPEVRRDHHHHPHPHHRRHHLCDMYNRLKET